MDNSLLNLKNKISFWDIIALSIIITVFMLFLPISTGMNNNLHELTSDPVTLDYKNLPYYAGRSVLRMFISVIISFIFTIIYAAIAAKVKRLEKIMISIVDILQSVPVLGFLSFTIAGFMSMFPGSILGVECAAIFAIFTSQAWNMVLSFYQSLKTIPEDLNEVATILKFSKLKRFVKLEFPFAIPNLIWNMMISMSSGWFFVVASEVITVGKHNYALPGIGSYISLAILHKDMNAIYMAIAMMILVIFIYDQILFRPLTAWAKSFNYDDSQITEENDNWVTKIFKKSKILNLFAGSWNRLINKIIAIKMPFNFKKETRVYNSSGKTYIDFIFWFIVLGCLGYFGYHLYQELRYIGMREILYVIWLGCLTAARIVVMVVIVSIVWVPVGIFIGLRPQIAGYSQAILQFLSAFPANIIFPVFVVFIVHHNLDPDIWLSPLMVVGTQWYILFNIVAGVSTMPEDLKEAIRSFKISGKLWWKKIMLPFIFPYYVTGAIAAAGGAWNASIVAEVVNWGDIELTASGIGAYITLASDADDKMQQVILGVAILSIFVIVFDKLIWHPLYKKSQKYSV